MCRNHLSPEGARQVAAGVRNCQTLKVLNMEACKLRSEVSVQQQQRQHVQTQLIEFWYCSVLLCAMHPEGFSYLH